GIDRQAEVLPGDAGLEDLGGVGYEVIARIALCEDDPRLSGEGVLVVLLDPVLALAVAIDEPEQLRGERCARRSAGERIEKERLGFEGDPGQMPAGHTGA